MTQVIMKVHDKFALVGALTMVLVVVMMTMVGSTMGQQAAGCQGDFQGLVSQCAVYVQKPGPVSDPSQGCCNVVRATDVQCACKYITAEIEAIINMAKVVHVAAFCGKPLDHGGKCGSYTVP